jgi:putative N6-adenine-specific DNA methylase
MTELASRGGLKLEAALRLFALDDQVRGARAVDIGASTGGFTEALLRGGARHVVAVDAGHDQLLPRLRDDARVHSLEGADWKTLALTVAPGPFDFFTVDVSFVAARSMLRGLAFRLRDGAHGVVLVKPQFELPESRLRAEKSRNKDQGKDAGAIDDPGLRRAALDKVSEKARRLGFTIVAHADSPVAGGSGTVEVLAHLRFDGRPASMPQPGERRPARAPATAPAARAAAAAFAPRRWFVISAPGLEEATAREVAALPGAKEVRAVDGGVEFTGPPEVGYRANLALRVATRVLARLGEVRAREFGKLRHGVGALPWEALIAPGVPIKVSTSASRCRLYHTGAIAETVELAIADRLARHGTPAPPAADAGNAEPPAAQTVMLRGVDDRFTISIDSSGERLHRRGWRQENAAAPLRETLAAGLLALCEWDPSMALYDPMCGAGTIPIEACAQAMGMAPGLDRHFAFEDWPLHAGAHRAAWERMREEALAISAERRRASGGAIADAPAGVGMNATNTMNTMILGTDRNAAAVESARRNATRAGFAAEVRIERRELVDARPFAERGLVLLNPPYGRRLGNRRTLGLLYREIGFVLRTHFRGWRAGVLVADRSLAEAIRLPVAAAYPLSNGGLRVTLLRYEIG